MLPFPASYYLTDDKGRIEFLNERKKLLFEIIKQKSQDNAPIAGFYKEIGVINQYIERNFNHVEK